MKRPFQTFRVGIVLALLLRMSAAAQMLHPEPFPHPVRIGEKYGFMGENCRLSLPPQFEYVWSFSEGMAAVESGGKWGYIDRGGAFAIPPQFAGASDFSDGVAGVRFDENGHFWGYIDKTGKRVIGPKVAAGLRFREGLAPFDV